jgi:hypothetical protein
MAWLSMFLPAYLPYFELARELYICWALWCFYKFLIGFMGGEEPLSNLLYERKEGTGLFGQRLILDGYFVQSTKVAIVQYSVIRCLLALATFILELVHSTYLYNVTANGGYIYIVCIHFVSQSYALFELGNFVR